MIIHQYVSLLLLTVLSCCLCQIVNLNTSSAIRRYRRVRLPAPHPLRAPSHTFGQPSLIPAPGEDSTHRDHRGHSPNHRFTQSSASSAAKREKPVRPPYAGFEEFASYDRRLGQPGSAAVRYTIDHSSASSNSRESSGAISQPVAVKVTSARDFDAISASAGGGGSSRRQRPAVSSFEHELGRGDQGSDKSQRSPVSSSTATGSEAEDDAIDFVSRHHSSSHGVGSSNNRHNLSRNEEKVDDRGDELAGDDVFATFNPLREISQPARIQFLYRDESFPKSSKPPAAAATGSPVKPADNQRTGSAFNRQRIDHLTSRAPQPMPFIPITKKPLRNDFREFVASSPLLPSISQSYSPGTRYATSTARYVTPPTIWYHSPAQTPAPPTTTNARSNLLDHQREAFLLKELRDERHSSSPPQLKPSTLSFSPPTSRPRDRDRDSHHLVSYYPEEVRSTSRSPAPPSPPPLPQHVTHRERSRDQLRNQHETRHNSNNNNNNSNNNNHHQKIQNQDRSPFSAPFAVRDAAAVIKTRDQEERVVADSRPQESHNNNNNNDHHEIDYRDDLGELPADRESLPPPRSHQDSRNEEREVVLIHERPAIRHPHQPPPTPPPAGPRIPTRIEFPSHREISTPIITQPTESPPPTIFLTPTEAPSNAGRSRQGRRIRPPKRDEDVRDESDRHRLPERPDRPERPAAIAIKDLPPSLPPVTLSPPPPKSTLIDEAYLRAAARGGQLEHGTPLGIHDYPIDDLKLDPPVESNTSANLPEDDVPRETAPPPPPTRKRSRNSSRRNRNKKKQKQATERVQQRLPVNYNRYASRPLNVYETPHALETATKCDPHTCLLPDCNCGHTKIPGNLPVHQVPQIILLTFDDAINDLNWELYQELFHSGRKNPNGCPPLGTFYVSHEWTDYGQVQTLYSMGHEMASHGVTHSFGEKFSKRQWMKEIQGQREVLHLYGGVKLEDVRGMRAPFLQVGGNKMFEMLYEANFTYDSSMPVFDNKPPFYPYTLDYALNHECMITPCPTKSFPGLWEVGMVMWEDLNGGRCSMGDACSNPNDEEGVHQMLMKNFKRHYESNRAPFGLFYHSAWFSNAAHRKGFIRFMDEILQNRDVFFTTNWQMIQWMRDPAPLDHINNFEPWKCDSLQSRRDLPDACHHPVVCNVKHETQGHRFMKTCQPCPDTYPWVGNTGFEKSQSS